MSNSENHTISSCTTQSEEKIHLIMGKGTEIIRIAQQVMDDINVEENNVINDFREQNELTQKISDIISAPISLEYGIEDNEDLFRELKELEQQLLNEQLLNKDSLPPVPTAQPVSHSNNKHPANASEEEDDLKYLAQLENEQLLNTDSATVPSSQPVNHESEEITSNKPYEMININQIVQKLEETEDVLNKKQEILKNKILKEREIIKKNGMKNKQLSMMSLRRKKRLEAQLQQNSGKLTVLESQRISLKKAQDLEKKKLGEQDLNTDRVMFLPKETPVGQPNSDKNRKPYNTKTPIKRRYECESPESQQIWFIPPDSDPPEDRGHRKRFWLITGLVIFLSTILGIVVISIIKVNQNYY